MYKVARHVVRDKLFVWKNSKVKPSGIDSENYRNNTKKKKSLLIQDNSCNMIHKKLKILWILIVLLTV